MVFCVSVGLLQHTHDSTPSLHDELIVLYYKSISKLLKEQPVSSTPYSTRAPPIRAPPRVPAGSEPGRLGILRKKLLSFLESSLYYTPAKMLSMFPLTELLEERAILLSRFGQHKQVYTLSFCHICAIYTENLVSVLWPYARLVAVYGLVGSSNIYSQLARPSYGGTVLCTFLQQKQRRGQGCISVALANLPVTHR